MVLDELGVLGAVVGVVPLVRRQQQLHQHVRHLRLVEGRVQGRVERQASEGLQQEAQQVLEGKKEEMNTIFTRRDTDFQKIMYRYAIGESSARYDISPLCNL